MKICQDCISFLLSVFIIGFLAGASICFIMKDDIVKSLDELYEVQR